jgi:alpha-N-arabinofuranosidase
VGALVVALAAVRVAAAPADPAPAPAAPLLPVTITVQADTPLQPTNPLLLGSNTPWVYGSEGLMDEAGRWRPGMMARAREWSPPVLRYMAGEPALHFRWRWGTGPLATRPPVTTYEGQPPQRIVFGTQEFLETCEALGSVPLVQVNLYEGSDAAMAKEAADWVRYTNTPGLVSRPTGRPLPKVRYWELGNEPYIRDSRQADGRPNPEFFRPKDYARRVSTVMAAMRAADPTARLGIPFALDTLSGRPWRPGGEPSTVVGEQLGYAEAMLNGIERPQDLGFLALHYYMPQVGDGGAEVLARLPPDQALYWGTVAGSETLRRHLQAVAQLWARHPRTAKLPLPALLITEYNAYFTNARRDGQEIPQSSYVATQAGALFVADLIRVLSEDPHVEAAMQWSLTGNWLFGAIKAPNGEAPTATPDSATTAAAPVRPVFHVMRLARELLAAGSRHVPALVATERTGQATTPVGHVTQVGQAAPFPDMPLATAVATRQGQTLRVMVINKDPARSAAVAIDLAGAQAAQALEAGVEQLHSPGVFAAPDSAAASTLQRPAVTKDRDGRRLRWTLEPASVALLTVQLQ